MATNTSRWVGNLNGLTQPMKMLGYFRAGATQAVKKGEIITRTATSDTWTPLAADSLYIGEVAVANEEIKSGDRAGYYEILVPRPEDVFEYAYASATNPSVGATVYYSSSEAITTTGTYPLGTIVGQQHYPQQQEHLADGGLADMGTTIANTSYARFVFNRVASYWQTVIGDPEFTIACTLTATGGEDKTIHAGLPFAVEVLHADFLANGTDAANVTLLQGSNAITDAIAKGTSDNYKITWLSVIDTYKSVAAETLLKVTFSGAGSIHLRLHVKRA